jgi:hypothetical protein
MKPTCFLGALILYFSLQLSPVLAQTSTHPSLLINPSDISELQSKATVYPWSEMKRLALERANEPTTDLNNTCVNQTYTLWCKSDLLNERVNYISLAYLLAPTAETKIAFKDKLVSILLEGWSQITPSLINPNSWVQNVPPGYAFFSSVIAYDLAYPDISASDRSLIEAKFQAIADRYYSMSDFYPESRHSVYGIWAIFMNDAGSNSGRTAAAVQGYSERVWAGQGIADVNQSGVSSQGIGYGWHRLSSNLYSKGLFMDVIEHTGTNEVNGKLYTFYKNPIMQRYFEWLYGASLSSRNRKFVFGDTSPTFFPEIIEQPSILRAGRFSSKAAGYAAWLLNNRYTPQPSVLHYLFYTPPAQAVVPKSIVYKDMASFYDTKLTSTNEPILSGALWNTSMDPGPGSSHNHRDINSIHLSGFGEDLLRNAGYAGYGSGCSGSTWDYVSKMSESNNTVIIDNLDLNNGQNCQGNCYGAGLTKQVNTPWLDHVTGINNPNYTLTNGTHQRDFIMIHSEADLGGYFVTVDEVTAANVTSSTTQAFFHPASNIYHVTTPNEEYRWHIKRYTPSEVYLTMFFGSKPSLTEVKDGGLCNQTSVSPLTPTPTPPNDYQSASGKYLKVTYPLSQGKTAFFHLLYPHSSLATKPIISRIQTNNGNGILLAYANSTNDILIQSISPLTQTSYGKATAIATWTQYRETYGYLSWYYVKQGSYFMHDQLYGFSSDHPITITEKGGEGSLVATVSTSVAFYHHDITRLSIDGKEATLTGTGSGWRSTIVSPGTHSFTFWEQPTTPSTDLDSDGDTDFFDFLSIITNFNQTGIGDFNFSTLVDIFDVTVLMRML